MVGLISVAIQSCNAPNVPYLTLTLCPNFVPKFGGLVTPSSAQLLVPDPARFVSIVHCSGNEIEVSWCPVSSVTTYYSPVTRCETVQHPDKQEWGDQTV